MFPFYCTGPAGELGVPGVGYSIQYFGGSKQVLFVCLFVKQLREPIITLNRHIKLPKVLLWPPSSPQKVFPHGLQVLFCILMSTTQNLIL